ncbi:ferredoxin--NADP reductase [Gammaproteobacteria bacterium]|nr:ferredoxin--NADP reductase [Gammaproteobacteria bacterium]
MSEWLEGKVVENIHWTDSLFSLKVDADIAPYSAGQFASLALEIDGERVARPYSFLSPPQDKTLEFFFYTATDGVLSNALYDLKAGDTILVKNPANGFFTLDEVPASRDLWLIGTGTGIAPFLSILKTDQPWETYESIILVQGVRTQSDMQYLDLITGLREQYGERFGFQAFISREQVEGTIQGRIPASIEDGSLEQRVNLKLDVAHSQVMLCGNPDMVKDVVELLVPRGFAKNLRRKPGHITTENYW